MMMWIGGNTLRQATMRSISFDPPPFPSSGAGAPILVLVMLRKPSGLHPMKRLASFGRKSVRVPLAAFLPANSRHPLAQKLVHVG